MKTTERTDNTRELPIHELKRSKWYRYLFYFFAFCPIVYVFTDFMNPTVEKLGIYLLYLPAHIIMVAVEAFQQGDIYFYERYVEIHYLLPFMKPYVMYYDKMHIHISKDVAYGQDHLCISHYRTTPNFFESKFTFEFIIKPPDYISLSSPYYCYTPEILEFLKTKAQSVNYYDKW